MACSIGVRHTLERLEPIVARRTTKLSAKCAGEHFVAGKAGVNRDCQDRLVAGNKPGGGAGQPQALRILFGSFSGKVAEGVLTTGAALGLANARGIEMPITAQVDAILHRGKSPREAVAELMRRPGRDEL